MGPHITTFYNQYAQWYEYIYKDYLERSIKVLNDILSQYVSKKKGKYLVVDMGCGVGTQIREVRNILNKEKKVVAVGIDISKNMMEKAKEKNDEIIYIEGDFTERNIIQKIKKQINEQHFDFILIMCLGNTLAHILQQKYHQFLNNIDQILKNFSNKNTDHLILLEFRNGKKLSSKKPLFEKLTCGLIGNNKLFVSFYFMDHGKKGRYPTEVYLFELDYSSGELTQKVFKNNISYYVYAEQLQDEMSKLEFQKIGTNFKSPLRFGEIWLVKKSKLQ